MELTFIADEIKGLGFEVVDNGDWLLVQLRHQVVHAIELRNALPDEVADIVVIEFSPVRRGCIVKLAD